MTGILKKTEQNALKSLIKMLQDNGITQFSYGDLSLTLNKLPTKAVRDITEAPQKSKEQMEQELLYYSAR